MVTRSDAPLINFDHPANRGVMSYLGAPERLRRSVSDAAFREECSPAEICDPYSKLGTHPELVTSLWDELGKGLPADCRRVVFGTPALVRPDSGLGVWICRRYPDLRVAIAA